MFSWLYRLDIDECHLTLHDCNQQAECVNNPGSFDCFCKSGFSGNGTSCKGMKKAFAKCNYKQFFI